MKRFTLYFLITFFSLGVSAQKNLGWKALKGEFNFIVANDLGRNGYYDQKPIAELMGVVAEEIGPEGVLALGDVHHFNGVRSTMDPLWTSNYEAIYSHPELMIPWYPICGNHEYRGNTSAVIGYAEVSRRWEMPAYYYSKTFYDDGVSLKIIFLDTTPLIDKYREDTEKYPDASKQDAQAQLSWLKTELENDTAQWTVVVGHHPIYADTPKADEERRDMQYRVDELLREHDVNMYICGHIHNFQHIRMPGSKVEYVVNSSGSLSRKEVKKTEGSEFVSGEPGFSVLTVSADSLTLSMINGKGEIIHTVSKKK